MSSSQVETGAKKSRRAKLAAIAEADAKSGRGDVTRGMCQRWTRERYEQVYGNEFDSHQKATAEKARRSWLGTPYAVHPSHGSMVGDILYKKGTGANPSGHVGIRIPGNRVAENGTRRTGRTRGGIGIVSLEEFGAVDLIVRLPK